MRQTDKGFVDKRFRGRSWHFYRCISKPRRLHFPTSPLFSFSRSRSGLRHYLDLTVTGVRFLPQEQHPYRVASLNSVFRRDCPAVRFYFGVSHGTRYDLSARSLNAPTILSFVLCVGRAETHIFEVRFVFHPSHPFARP